MDEASSKFVDQLAVERIVQEKLGRVHHSVNKPWRTLCEPVFDTFGMSLALPRDVKETGQRRYTMSTPIKWSPHRENNTIFIHRYPAPRTTGAVLLIHGLYEDNREIYRFFISELNRHGLDVYMSTLPFHHERTPHESHFSGEYFLSGDLERTKQAFCQAVIETRYLNNWLYSTTDLPIYVVGFSMGGTVALAGAGASDDMTDVAVVNPASNLFEVVWTSPLCATIRADLSAAGLGATETRAILSSFDPFVMPHLRSRHDHQLLIYGLFDQITRADLYEALIEAWGFDQVLRYKAGHLNTLRVPRFAADVARFFNSRQGSTVSFPGGVA